MSKKLTITEMQRIASERGGKCLSKKYKNNRTNLLWECSKGHQWKAKPNHIKNGTWCPVCGTKRSADVQKLSISEMKKIAKERGGKCLSNEYVNAQSKLLWECVEGHQWEATPGCVKHRTWCPVCGKKNSAESQRLSISDMKKLAKEKGGRCLSTEYVNARSKLLWKCSEGHQWEAVPGNISRGSWCPICGLKNSSKLRKLSINEMQLLAEERGGNCLSRNYVSAKSNLMWECSEGHQWKATPNNVQRGTWCPICSDGIGERICREFFEQIFNKKFKKYHPKWLINKDGNKLELDGYCPSLKIAFEHQGIQHYSMAFFHNDIRSLKKLQHHDQLKKKICAKHNIKLFQIPEIPTKLSINNVKNYIKKECKKLNVELPDDFESKNIDLCNAYSSNSKQALNELKKIAGLKNGKCISDLYLGANKKLIWECSEGHQWKSTAGSVKSGTWCPTCSGNEKLTIEEMKKIASYRGGKCLSNNYINSKTKLLWECSKGHQWRAIPLSIKRGRWCPKCAPNFPSSIDDIKNLAIERGGKCLSSEYVNAQSKLLWECAEGHQWEATSNNIQQGNWCRICGIKNRADSQRLSISDMKELAKEKGGKCLSTNYINSKTKLFWECSEEHKWEAIPSAIKRGTWCPYCSGNAKDNIEEMKSIAKSHNGKCLSKQYLGAHQKLLWECSEGHQWEAVPSSIKRGSWCRICSISQRSKSRRLTIEEMRLKAKDNGGKCISTEYVNAHKKLIWECSNGHQWEASPSNIKSGKWCPICRKRKRD